MAIRQIGLRVLMAIRKQLFMNLILTWMVCNLSGERDAMEMCCVYGFNL